jgi:hypothetical protein
MQMPDDAPLKSAYELAMERLRAKDREAGIQESRPLTAKQKREIARLRQEARAKTAELEIMRRDKLAATEGDPEKVAEVEEHFALDKRRVESSLQQAIEAVKRRKKG